MGLGIDIIEISRFIPFKKSRKDLFLLDNYSPAELDYCFSFQDPAPHLAGIFAAKEAVVKCWVKEKITLSAVEIKKEPSGRPVVWINHRRQKLILVSISHSNKIALAIAIKQ